VHRCLLGVVQNARLRDTSARGLISSLSLAPELVTLLCQHLDACGTAADGRLFHGRRAVMLSESIYGRVWQRARVSAFTKAQGIRR
jgi:hypothetical protein